jgi:hypothetical protein
MEKMYMAYLHTPAVEVLEEMDLLQPYQQAHHQYFYLK